MSLQKLTELYRIADAAFEAEQAKLAALTRREVEMRAQLSDLSAQKRGSILETDQSGTPAERAGAEVRWHRWIDSRRETLNRELAQVLAQRARHVGAVRKAFGKKEALAALVARTRAETQLAARRRTDQTS